MRLCAVGTALILLVALGAPPPCEAGPGNWLQAAGRIGGALVRAWNGKNDSKKLDGKSSSKNVCSRSAGCSLCTGLRIRLGRPTGLSATHEAQPTQPCPPCGSPSECLLA